jgi:tRNA(Ile)-lysidine synthase
VSAADDARPIAAAEARSLFSDLADHPVLIVAVSGGPDSTALLLLLARWREPLRRGPKLVAVTIDHGLRPESRREAVAVKRLARSLGVAHRTLRWAGRKPRSGLQRAARDARYRLLASAAKSAGAHHVLTAHTLDDQAETVLIRLARGSGVSGLAAMAREASWPGAEGSGLTLVRPLLTVPKSRLIATLGAVKSPYAEDPSNLDPKFTRARLRALMPALAREGLGPRRLAMLARRVRRSEAAIEAAVDDAAARLAPGSWPAHGPVVISVQQFSRLPEEVALRLLGRAIGQAGDEGPVELAKLETLAAAVLWAPPGESLRRTLAGAQITLARGCLTIVRAPPRRRAAAKPP